MLAFVFGFSRHCEIVLCCALGSDSWYIEHIIVRSSCDDIPCLIGMLRKAIARTPTAASWRSVVTIYLELRFAVMQVSILV